MNKLIMQIVSGVLLLMVLFLSGTYLMFYSNKEEAPRENHSQVLEDPHANEEGDLIDRFRRKKPLEESP